MLLPAARGSGPPVLSVLGWEGLVREEAVREREPLEVVKKVQRLPYFILVTGVA